MRRISGRGLRNPIVFAGFVGAGLVGPLAVGHMAREMGMAEIAYMKSRSMPPSTVFMQGRLRHPFRFCATSDGSVCAVICEITLGMSGVQGIVDGVLDWAASEGSREIVILDGVAGDGHDGRAYCAAEADLCRVMADRDVAMIPQGYIAGVPGGILSECLLREIKGVALLARARRDGPDPAAAATLVEAVNRVYGTSVPTAGLLEDAERTEADFRDMSRGYAEHRAKHSGMYM